MAEIEVLSEGPYSLGEGSMWDVRTRMFSWVDIEGRTWQTRQPGGDVRTYPLSGMPGTAVLTEDPNRILLALDTGLTFLDVASGEERRVGDFPGNAETMRFNDGKCDPAGRLWIGSMDRGASDRAGTLYRVGPDLKLVPVLKEVTISNGICWSRQGNTMYYIDSPSRQVDAFDFDLQQGELSNRRTVVKIPDGWGYPDGMTIDAEDRLWVAHWDGKCVACYDPESGEAVQKVDVPAEKVTSCWFGGLDLDTLIITTALGSADGGWADRETFPLSGATFTIKPGAKGLPSNEFRIQRP